MKKTRFQLFACFIVLSMFPLAICGDEMNTVEVSKEQIHGIYNYSHNADPTGFGGTTDPSAMKALADKGYKSVINLRLAGEDGNDLSSSRAEASRAGLTYIHLPFDSSNPPPDFFDHFLAALGDEANLPVYIHCGSATRVAALWMSKRIIEDGWSKESAEAEARAIAGKPDAAVAFATKYIELQQN